MIGAEAGRTTAENYRRFAEREARGKSPLYEELAAGIADDDEVLALIDTLPPGKRQPNLVLAAARFLYGTPTGYPGLRATLIERWAQVRSVALARSTQTNEVGRCAALLPVLAELRRPLALIEIGASAGLCLLLDRYHYDYGTGARLGPADSRVRLDCELRGPGTPPAHLPAIVWRVGLDLDPVDVTDPDAVRWLETLVWPGQTTRLRRLRSALELATVDPPPVVRGDLRTDLPRLVAGAPADATMVVFHSAVLAYLPAADRARFAEQVAGPDVTWIGYEAPGVVAVADPPPAPPPDTGSAFLITHDGRQVAWADPHGAWLRRT
ncbi:DUF2332 domain-containing protein [Pseudonocardia nantongensis]|uniref:DUF2332 domain-containing protein n=1 Tax=Pseudonocardia nantongensis TaxID=1181885 RepID=UPI00397AE693